MRFLSLESFVVVVGTILEDGILVFNDIGIVLLICNLILNQIPLQSASVPTHIDLVSLRKIGVSIYHILNHELLLVNIHLHPVYLLIGEIDTSK